MIPRHKPPGYHTGCNQLLLRAVPPDACRILDVGCGTGQLGAALKQLNPARTVYGVEIEAQAAAQARQRLDEVFVLDAQRDSPPLPERSLDCLLFGDLLEYLIDPEDVLSRYVRLLSPRGVVLSSLPNVQHHSVLAALLCGDFQYEAAGLLDAGPLRCFS
jgi:O-antigen biosynthesis protein